MKNFTEIIFEKRNKSYGAYVLRTKYGKNIIISMIVGILFLASLMTYPVIASYINRNNHINNVDKEVGVNILNIPNQEFVPPPPMQASPINVPKFLVPKVVDDEVESDMETQDNLSTSTNVTPITETTDIEVKENNSEPAIEIIEPPAEIFTVVEEQPYLDGMYEFLSENIKYPSEARELGIEGRVFVTFVVEADGTITNVKLLRGIGGGCDEEAVRLVQSMPKWTPGKQRGNNVRVQFNIPIKFTLN